MTLTSAPRQFGPPAPPHAPAAGGGGDGDHSRSKPCDDGQVSADEGRAAIPRCRRRSPIGLFGMKSSDLGRHGSIALVYHALILDLSGSGTYVFD